MSIEIAGLLRASTKQRSLGPAVFVKFK